VWSGIETTCTIDQLSSGTYYFVVRAYPGSNESGDSNQIKVVINDSIDSDNDGLTDIDETNLHRTDPYNPDSDGDGYRDGEEINAGTDPNDDSDHLHLKTDSSVIYEDAEDGKTGGWYIYDKTPSGASIANVYDSSRRSSVIELAGSGTSNGFRLRNEDGSKWNNSTQFIIEWSMKYSEYFVIYVDLETTEGHRYLVYRPIDNDGLGGGEYINFGIGRDTMDGRWQTFSRDLLADLALAQPGVKVLKVNGFLMRGSGRVDDIMLKDANN
jgi:hypothetical protein